MVLEWRFRQVAEVANVTDYVANGSFESLRNNVTYLDDPDYAILVRLVDYSHNWKGGFVYVDKASFDFLRKTSLRPGDIVVSNVGAHAGAVFRIPDLGKPMTLGPNALLCRPKSEDAVLRGFLYYYLVSEDGQAAIASILSGSAQPKFNKTDFRKLSIPVCPLPEQRAIAHILGTLDDRIELNRRMNQTLEAMAQALFKSWFVDFGPFRDRGMQDSPLGEIPAGWGVATLGDIAKIHDSQRVPLSRRERASRRGVYPYYGATSIMDYVDDYIFDGIYVLMAEDGSVVDDADHAVVQYVWGRFWVNNHAHVLQGSNTISTEHLMLFLRHVIIHPYITGAVQPKLNQENMRRIPFVMPPPDICGALQEMITPVYSSFRSNIEQIDTLAAIRDALLPKLLSGEIRVKDARRFVEDTS